MAQNGFCPMPEIQFLAYLHNAEDQLRGEAATLPFFSNGQFSNPMVLRIAGLGYQKGFGGHFHNDNSVAVLRDMKSEELARIGSARNFMIESEWALQLREERGMAAIRDLNP
jgi:2-oxoisovalerate dehydrogenase E1 component